MHKYKGLEYIIAGYCALKPLYLNSSGTLQLCDIFLILALMFLFFRLKGNLLFPKYSKKLLTVMGAVVLYQITVNCLWSFALKDDSLFIKSSYYIFNFIVFGLCCLMYRYVGFERLRKSLTMGCFMGICITMLGIVMNSGIRLRSLAFFNNPNQLGYYATIVLTVLVLWPQDFSLWKKRIMLFGSLWAIVCSGSKAAVVGGLFLLYYWYVFDGKKLNRNDIIKQVGILFGLLILCYIALYSDLFSDNRTVSFMRDRMLNMASENDSNLGSGRAYNRIFEMDFHWLWGMGEGAYYRFVTMPGYEIHSTYMNIIVSYGLIGTLGYVYLYKLCVLDGRPDRRYTMLLSAILLYFITHNGIRNSLFWIVMAVIYLEIFDRRKNRVKQQKRALEEKNATTEIQAEI